MQIALKEWQLVIDALAAGRQIFLLRKGGIAEGKTGFEPKHRSFLFFPTWEHQHTGLVKPEFRAEATPDTADPERITFRHAGEVAHVAEAPHDRTAFARIPQAHIWNEAYLQMRYNYRPDLPLYLLTIRAYHLDQPVTLPRDRRYKGCRSWVMLNTGISTSGMSPALDDENFAARQEELLDALGLPRSSH